MPKTLILSDNDEDVDAEALAEAAQGRGWAVAYAVEAGTNPTQTLVYGPADFCQRIALEIGLKLHAPNPADIATLPPALLNRKVEVLPLAQAWQRDEPMFVKGLQVTVLPGAVYDDGSALHGATGTLPPETPVIVSEVLTTVYAEGRAFINEARVVTATIYEGEAEMMEAAVFASTVAWDYAPPFAFVIDVAFDPDRGWCVTALRPVWSAELYDCDPDTVLDCLENAISPTL